MSHQELAEKYMKEVLDARRKIFEAETAAADKDELIARLEQDLAASRAQANDGRGDCGNLVCETRTRSRLREECDAAKQQMAESTAALEGRTAELRELRNAIEDGRSMFYEQDQKLEESEQELAGTKAELSVCQTELHEAREHHTSAVSRVGQLEQKAACLGDQNARLHNDTMTLEGEVNRLKAQIVAQEQIATQHEAEAQHEAAQVLELQTSCSKLAQAAATLRLENTALEEKAQNLRDQLAEQEQLAARYRAEAESEAAANAEHRASYSTLEQDFETLRREKEARERHARTLEDKHAGQKTQCNSQHVDTQSHAAQLPELRTSHSTLQQEVTALQHDKAALEIQAHTLSTQLAEQKTLAAAHHADARDPAAANLELQAAHRQRLAGLTRCNEELKAETNRLEAQLKGQCQRNVELKAAEQKRAAREAATERVHAAEIKRRMAREAALEQRVEASRGAVVELRGKVAEGEGLAAALRGLVESKQARIDDVERLLREKDDGEEG